jgi:hypothetical protein
LLTMTDDFPFAKAFVIITASPILSENT